MKNIKNFSKTEYEEIDRLPRWAYSDNQWRALIESADIIIGDRFFKKIQEPAVDELDIFIGTIEGL